PFERIVRGVRVVQADCVAALLDVAEADPKLMRALTEAVAAFFDASVDATVSRYLRGQERRISRRLAARRTMVAAIRDGDEVRAEDVRRSLDVEIDGPHLAMIAWAGERPASVGDSVDLERSARRAAEVLRCRSLVVLPGDDGLWIWLGRVEPFTEEDLA